MLFRLEEIPVSLVRAGSTRTSRGRPVMPIEILDVEVIPFGDEPDRWAVAIRYSNGRRQLIELGNRFQAEKEASRLRREEIKPSSERSGDREI